VVRCGIQWGVLATVVVMLGKWYTDIMIVGFIEYWKNGLRSIDASKSAPTYAKTGVAEIKISTF
jgi:hypothetical protein